MVLQFTGLEILSYAKLYKPDCNGSTMCTFLRVVKAGVEEVEEEEEEEVEGEEGEAVLRTWLN